MLKVLIADEDVSLTKSSSDFLLQNNLSIDTSSSGVETVSKYLTSKPNILVLDSSFSDLKTSKIIDIISNSSDEKKNRNVVLTINPETKTVDFTNTSKIYSFVKKPYSKQVLLDSIKNLSNSITIQKPLSLLEDSFVYNIFINLGLHLGLEGNKYLLEIIKYYYYHPYSTKKLEQLYKEIGIDNHLSSEAIRSSVRTALKYVDPSKNGIYINLFEKNREITPRYFIDTILPYIYKKLNKKE